MKIVFAGLGGAGRMHLRNAWAHPDLDAAAFCDPNEDCVKAPDLRTAMEKLAAEGVAIRSLPKFYDDWDRLLDSEKPDIAVVSSPDRFHCSQVVAALDRGVPVLVEKPMAGNLGECEDILRAQEKTGAKVMVDHCCRFARKFQEIHRRIAQGDIGTVYYAESNYVSDRYDQLNKYRHHLDLHPLVSVGIHPIDLIRWMVGSEVVEVSAESTRIAAEGTKWPWPDLSKVNMRFANTALAMSYTTHAIRRPGYQGLLLYGTKASVFDDHPYYTPDYYYPEFDKWGASDLYRIFKSREWAEHEELRLGPDLKGSGHMFAPVLTHFLEAIKHNREPLVSAREGAKSLAVCFAAVESLAANGKPVKPKTF